MSSKRNSIGFMQGRLSECVEGKIQAFPWSSWETEFPAAVAIDLHLIEWTLDQERLYENPLLTKTGQARIKKLCEQYGIGIPSLTGDCFMQAPFWKAEGETRANLQNDFLAVSRACGQVGINMIVVPLVDNGGLTTSAQEDVLVNFCLEYRPFLSALDLQILFESDFTPTELARFINRLPDDQFGINYDIGNSAALGFAPDEEFAAYGKRIKNVHIKDRVLGGATVPLTKGNADFDSVFNMLSEIEYQGNYILQTARAVDGDHAEVLKAYRAMTNRWIEEYGLMAVK
jgi:L-ribulose-5-phosphate 3-epimerase